MRALFAGTVCLAILAGHANAQGTEARPQRISVSGLELSRVEFLLTSSGSGVDVRAEAIRTPQDDRGVSYITTPAIIDIQPGTTFRLDIVAADSTSQLYVSFADTEREIIAKGAKLRLWRDTGAGAIQVMATELQTKRAPN